jgi:hypothetical protein
MCAVQHGLWSLTHVLQGAGHFSHEDAPEQIVDAIKSWFVLSSRETESEKVS